MELNYQKNARCKICKSNEILEIDSFLAKGDSYQSIINWSKKACPQLELTKKNLSNHNTIHRLKGKPNPNGRGRRKGFSNEKVLEVKESDKDLIIPETEELSENSDIIMDQADRYLDKLISLAYDKLLTGKIPVTVTEAIKAIELKHKISKGSPFEDTIFNFIEKVVDNSELPG